MHSLLPTGRLHPASIPASPAPVTMAGRPEGVVMDEVASGVVVRMSWVMR